MAQTNVMPMGPWKVSLCNICWTLHYPSAQGAAGGWDAWSGAVLFQISAYVYGVTFVLCRSPCTTRSTSRADAWSSPPAARTSWSVAWRTSVPWRSSVARTYPEIEILRALGFVSPRFLTSWFSLSACSWVGYEHSSFCGQQFVLEKGDYPRFEAYSGSNSYRIERMISFRPICCAVGLTYNTGTARAWKYIYHYRDMKVFMVLDFGSCHCDVMMSFPGFKGWITGSDVIFTHFHHYIHFTDDLSKISLCWYFVKVQIVPTMETCYDNYFPDKISFADTA